MKTFVRTCNALLIIVMTIVLFSAIYQEFHGQGLPCPYCWLQRMGMMGVSTALLMNLRFGIRLKPYTIALFFAFIGGAVALRQISFHVCPEYPTFGYPVMGFNLYTWSFIVFCCAATSIFIFLFLYEQKQEKPEKMHPIEWLAFIGIVAVTLTNCGLLYAQCGFERCKEVPPPQHAFRASR